MSNQLLLSVVAASVCTIAGCGSGDDTTNVSGKVVISGQAMGAGAVTFYPAGGDRPIGAAVDSSGHYSVNLSPGEYSIVVMTSTPPPAGWKEGDPLPPPKVEVPRQYTQPRTTPLRLTVADADLSRDFEL